ncbi:MarR family winged helix-turn-helix transcriptional regulator [Myroides odoratimimus]|uniref:MarR family winged helix-turn-helix transcriptional regulator n=1 Tax=Myroides odoratimimus TaxID=76832 RepID=UPI0025768DF0|nr:MarR family winged helix-turn-helix transcriptional regulator [Myroides odoratimimus]MDM1513499.1 winged helix-turn-helix transcriptional regulator [Myroides odoratimimus]
MKYQLLKELLDLVIKFENENSHVENNVNNFLTWSCQSENKPKNNGDFTNNQWEGKNTGRSPESVINTLIVHMNKYAKFHSRLILNNSEFTSQEDFIYLITLKSFGEMSKNDLIKKNIQEKNAGIKIINRLIKKGFISQKNSKSDKRSKIVAITDLGLKVLEDKMPVIRKVTNLVTGDLTEYEKHQLIYLLQKLDNFHNPLYNNSNIEDLNEEDFIDN